jgi:hypothetical protein
MGTMPESECSLRQRNEWPTPGRNGLIPGFSVCVDAWGGAGGAVVAIGDAPEVMPLKAAE